MKTRISLIQAFLCKTVYLLATQPKNVIRDELQLYKDILRLCYQEKYVKKYVKIFYEIKGLDLFLNICILEEEIYYYIYLLITLQDFPEYFYKM